MSSSTQLPPPSPPPSSPPHTVLLTGASGFLGPAILRAFHDAYPTWHLWALDLHPLAPDSDYEDLSHDGTPQEPAPWDPSSVPFLQADVRDFAAVQRALAVAQPDLVIHAAGRVPQGGARYDGRDWEAVMGVNVGGTATVARAAAASGTVAALVGVGSVCVVSDELGREWRGVREEDVGGQSICWPGLAEGGEVDWWAEVERRGGRQGKRFYGGCGVGGGPRLVYGESKALAESILLAYDEVPAPVPGGAMRTLSLRPSTIFGPAPLGQAAHTIVPPLCRMVERGETPFVIGDGNNLYDFLPLASAARAVLRAAEHLLRVEGSPGVGGGRTESSSSSSSDDDSAPAGAPAGAGRAFFISNAEPLYFRDFCLAIWKAMGHVPPFTVRVPRPLAWAAGLAAEVWGWARGGESEGALSRGSVGDAVAVAWTDPTAARRVLGYERAVGVEEGIAWAVRDWRRRVEKAEKEKGKGE